MPWLRLKLGIDADHVDLATEALAENGAMAVSIVGLDRVVDALPVEVSGLFSIETDVACLLNRVGTHAPSIQLRSHSTEILADQDWARVWLKHSKPLCVGDDLWVCPSAYHPRPGVTNVRLDPGLAFGTGAHPSTTLCLQWLSEQQLKARSVIDYGCGSGILAIAALLRGARAACGLDNDPSALAVSRANATRNGVRRRYKAYDARTVGALPRADIVVANILAETLIALASTLTGLVRSDGYLVLSGILPEQMAEVSPHYAQFEFTTRTHAGWALLIGRMRPGNLDVDPLS